VITAASGWTDEMKNFGKIDGRSCLKNATGAAIWYRKHRLSLRYGSRQRRR